MAQVRRSHEREALLPAGEIGLEPLERNVGVTKARHDRYLGQVEQPTRAMIEEQFDLWEDIERGQGVYVIAYKDGKPSEIFFGGYSYD